MQNVSGRVIARHHAELLEESARLDDLKSMFLRLTTHELRAPLGTIRGYASMLESGDLGELSAPATQAIGAIASAAGVALSLIEQLVEVSRLDIGTEALHPAPVPLAELIADAAALVARDAEAAGIRLAIDSTSAAVECDRERLIVAVRNLLHNAVKYSPPRSKVTVTGTVAADAVIEVADEGGGIPESELPRLFDRYYRGAGVRGKPDGSGLGLYITKRIAELHGGDVEVSSTPGSGSRFRIRIPTRAA
jgi:two-component system sensor histidine kinase BaeS